MAMNPRLLRPKASSAFDPRNVSGLALWLDGSDSASLYNSAFGGSLVAADGAIARWQDKSGNARHAVQSTANNRPLRKAGAVNGLDAVLFDATNDRFLITASLSQPLSFYIACYPTSVTSNSFIDTNARMICGFYSSAGQIRMYAGSANCLSNAGVVPANASALIAAIFNHPSSALMVNGAAAALDRTDTGNGGTSGSILLGAYQELSGGFYAGYMCEILAYTSVLSTTDRTAVEKYLKKKWGVA